MGAETSCMPIATSKGHALAGQGSALSLGDNIDVSLQVGSEGDEGGSEGG